MKGRVSDSDRSKLCRGLYTATKEEKLVGISPSHRRFLKEEKLVGTFLVSYCVTRILNDDHTTQIINVSAYISTNY